MGPSQQYSNFILNIAEKNYHPDEILVFFYVNDFMNPDYYYDGEPLAPIKLPKNDWGQSELGLRRYVHSYNHFRRLQEKKPLNRRH